MFKEWFSLGNQLLVLIEAFAYNDLLMLSI